MVLMKAVVRRGNEWLFVKSNEIQALMLKFYSIVDNTGGDLVFYNSHEFIAVVK